MVTIPEPMETDVRLGHLSNEFFPMIVTLSGMEIDVRLEQS